MTYRDDSGINRIGPSEGGYGNVRLEERNQFLEMQLR
jgi:hypothetical protein